MSEIKVRQATAAEARRLADFNRALALESEGSPTEFRNIRIKEWPSTGATAEQTAPLAK